MPTITITKEQFNALQVCKAGPKDPRYYLAGIHVDLNRDLIESTDGHRCLRIINLTGEPFDEQYIFSIQGKAPAKCEKVNICKEHIMFVDKTGNVISTVIPQIIDGTFPDTNRVIPNPEDIDRQTTELKSLAINPQYLYDVAKVLIPSKDYLVTNLTFLEDMSIMVSFGKCDMYKNIEYKIMLVKT